MDLEDIIRSIDELSSADKVVLRNYLETEVSQTSLKNVCPDRQPLIGLLADDPQLADEILESAMRARESRPFRISSE